MNKEVFKLIKYLLLQIYKSQALISLFMYSSEKTEFMPLSILLLYLNEENFFLYDKTPFLIISKIKDKETLRIIRKTHEFTLNLVSKLAFYFQMKNIAAITAFSQFLQDFYTSCANKEFQEEIIEIFYENFCAQILTPRLQSSEVNIRINASILLTIVIEEIKAPNILLAIVYFFQGKEANGNKRLKPLVSTPTKSSQKSFEFTVNLNKVCKPLADMTKM